MSDDTKACPFCAEDIKAAAIVCKHCGRELNGFQDTISKTQDSDARKLVRRKEPLEISIRRIFDFKGKANRIEFAVYTIGPFIFLLPLTLLLSLEFIDTYAFDLLGFIFFLIYFTAILSVSFRRLHDLGRDSLLVFLYLVPVVNIITFLNLLFTPGSTKMEKKKRRKKRW